MKIGDKVRWKSQSQSYCSEKTGDIVAVVPTGTTPVIPKGFRCNSSCGYGMARNHESYLVKVDGKGNRLYWPIVSKLKLAKA